jgi:hypothetical protein
MASVTVRRFDASIDLPAAIVPPEMPPGEAVSRVRRAVEALPGAGCVSVDWSGLVPPGLPWLCLFEPGKQVAVTGGAWGSLAGDIQSAAQRALRR